ncbi:MAG: EAL domain-containing protein [Pseudomonadota bacterium]
MAEMTQDTALPKNLGPDSAVLKTAPGAAGIGYLVIDAWGMIQAVNPTFLAAANPSGNHPDPTDISEFELRLDMPTSVSACRLGGRHKLVWVPIPDGGWAGTLLEDQTTEALPPSGTDALTGVGDRQSLPGQYEAMRGEERGYALFLDLDRFKRVNDTLGHDAGDALLRSVARRLRSVLRSADYVARLGGDEFVALINGEVDETEVKAIAERVIDKLSRPFLVNGMQVLVGASIGLARSDGVNLDEALRRADVALYESKRLGRGRATWYTPEMTAALEKRRDLEHALRKALLLEEFVVYFQPQYSFGTSSITGFEALVRWKQSDGIVPPSEFIPVAEETGLMVDIGSYVLNVACREASEWPQPLTVAVNISPLQFMDDGFLESIQDCLSRWGLPPERLELELTESVLANEDFDVEARMRALQKIGVSLSLDNFGTEYASINCLSKYAFNKIKIDQSFVRDALADDASHKIAGAVAGLGIDLGVNVIAEGIETEEQLARLRAQGVGAMQGFLLSEPIPADKVSSFVANWSETQNLKEHEA